MYLLMYAPISSMISLVVYWKCAWILNEIHYNAYISIHTYILFSDETYFNLEGIFNLYYIIGTMSHYKHHHIVRRPNWRWLRINVWARILRSHIICLYFQSCSGEFFATSALQQWCPTRWNEYRHSARWTYI